ncbi:MAG: diguanylate cyclase [Mariprofundus sp.]|nr:diguanylate cyclase [Mariprofundus sp.]
MVEQKSIVLLVDDQKTVHMIIKKLLSSAPDIELHSCFDGTLAVQCAEELQPTVILQDIHVDEVNGLDLLDCYRANKATAQLSVIILSAMEDVESKAEAFERGADDYLVKMPHPVELIARVRHHSKAYRNHLERNAAVKELECERAKLSKANLELKRLSSMDGLTNIANRRCFDTTLEREWRRALRQAEPLSLIMIDVDHFKLFNDGYGHQAGDDCLKAVALALAHIVNRPADLLARYGGEEFVALLPHTDVDGALTIAEAMRSSIEGLQLPHAYSTSGHVVAVSLGLASIVPTAEDSAAALIKAADEALYRAKDTGRNRIVSSQC